MMLTIALPTGRVFSDAAEMIAGAGLPCDGLASPGRKLVIEAGNSGISSPSPLTFRCT